MDGRSDGSAPTLSGTAQLASFLLLTHALLVTSFGQAYAKYSIPIGGLPLYPTDLVLLISSLAVAPRLLAVPSDRFTKIVIAFVLLGTFWVAIGGLGGMSGAGAKAFSFFVYSLFYFLVRAVATSASERWRVLRIIGLASFVATSIGVWQMQSGTPLLTPTFEATTTGSIRWLPGEFALYGLLATTYAMVEVILQRRITFATGALLAAAAAELVLAQHRSGFVALAIALAATVFFLAGSTQALKGLLKIGALVCVGLVIFIWLFGGGYLDETFNRISSINDMNDVNIGWRLLSWYEVADGIAAQPLGHGFAVWDFAFTSLDPLTGSHNSFLDLTYRVGIPGLLLLVTLPVALIHRTRRLVQSGDPRQQMFLVTVCASMLAFLVYASFNVVLETPYMSIFFWVLLGLGSGALEEANRAPPPVRA